MKPKVMTIYEVEVETTNYLRDTWMSADGVCHSCKHGIAYVASADTEEVVRFLGDSWRNARRMGQVLMLTGDKEESHD